MLNRRARWPSRQWHVRPGQRRISRHVHVRRGEVARPAVLAVANARTRTYRRVFEGAHQFVPDVFTADDVQVEVDAVVEVRE